MLPEKNFSKYLAQLSWVISKRSVKIKTLCWKKTSGTTNSKRWFRSNTRRVQANRVQENKSKKSKKINSIKPAEVTGTFSKSQSHLIRSFCHCSNFRDIKTKICWIRLWPCSDRCLVKEETWLKITKKCWFAERVISIKCTWLWSLWETNSTFSKTTPSSSSTEM